MSNNVMCADRRRWSWCEREKEGEEREEAALSLLVVGWLILAGRDVGEVPILNNFFSHGFVQPCDVLTIFQLAYRQHDLLANNHVGRLL